MQIYDTVFLHGEVGTKTSQMTVDRVLQAGCGKRRCFPSQHMQKIFHKTQVSATVPAESAVHILIHIQVDFLPRIFVFGMGVEMMDGEAAALKIADRGYVMERGRITIEGTAKELLGDDRVRQAYLGKSVV